MSSTSKLIVVVGATGNQGSSVAKHFLSLPNWRVRAVTRNVSSSAAQSLALTGAEVHKGDLSDLTSLSNAFEGAHAIFVNTDFWGHYRGFENKTEEERATNGKISFDMEVQHGKNAAIAAADVPSLERYVYSALGPMKKASKGKYCRSHHWDSKAAIVEYIETCQPELAQKSSFIYLGCYANNPLVSPKADPATGSFRFVFPFKKEFRMPIVIADESTGNFVHALIENEPPKTKLLAYNEYLSLIEVAACWSKATGKVADIVEITPEFMHQEQGYPWEVLEAVHFLPEYGYMGGIDGFIEPSQLKVPTHVRSYQDWVGDQKW